MVGYPQVAQAACGQRGRFCGGGERLCGGHAERGKLAGKTSPKVLAEPGPEDIELLPRPPPGGRDRSERRPVRRTTSVLEDRCGSRVTRLPGSERRRDRSGASPVPISRRALVTHTHKGPSPISASTVPRRLGPVHRKGPGLCITGPSLWMDRVILWTPGKCPEKIPETLVPAPPHDIELLPRPPPGGRDRSERRPVRRTTSVLEDRCGSRVARLPGSERRPDRSGASPVPVNRRALATHTHKGPSPIWRRCALVLRRGSPQECLRAVHEGMIPVDGNAHSVDNDGLFGIHRKQFPKRVVRTRLDGIELSYALLRESGIGRSRRSVRRFASLLEKRRGGRVTRSPGSDARTGSIGASPMPVNRRALATHTREGPSPFPAVVRPRVGRAAALRAVSATLVP